MRKHWLLALLVAATGAQAGEPIPPSPVVKTELVADAAPLLAGQPAWVGVAFTIPEHWHIYWQNPGDSGIPTAFEWSLPEGVRAGNMLWPVPERIEVSGLVNYGYSNRVVLVAPLTPSRDGGAVPLKLKASWLVCRDICIPEHAEFAATLPLHQHAAAAAQAHRAAAAMAPLTAGYGVTATRVELRVPGLPLDARAVQWFPLEDGVVQNAGAASFARRDGTAVLTLARGESEPVQPWHGVLVAQTAQGRVVYAVTAQRDADGFVAPAAPAHGLLALLALAFLGGLVLNVMPCVLPILALKALAIARKAAASRRSAALQGVTYTAGVVVSFLGIAGAMLALRASGAAVGWGFQLQHATVVLMLGGAMLLVAANLLGLFTLPVLFGRHAHEINESSAVGSFLTGALAVLVATPCTAPFMATAIGATLALPAAATLAIFAALGLGMASPFLLISLWPAARRALPKPGAWMQRFKQWLALPMLATAAWLFWVAAAMHHPARIAPGAEAYSAARLAALRAQGTPVLVDATAAWCLSCKVNERVALKPDAMQHFFKDRGVAVLVADWTRNDPAITAFLAGFGRNGVPLYVYYPPHAAPRVLPQLLTPGLVRAAIDANDGTK